MKKISFKNLDNLGIEKMSTKDLKSVTGGLMCPNELILCGDVCMPPEFCDDQSGCSNSNCTGSCRTSNGAAGSCRKTSSGICKCASAS